MRKRVEGEGETALVVLKGHERDGEPRVTSEPEWERDDAFCFGLSFGDESISKNCLDSSAVRRRNAEVVNCVDVGGIQAVDATSANFKVCHLEESESCIVAILVDDRNLSCNSSVKEVCCVRNQRGESDRHVEVGKHVSVARDSARKPLGPKVDRPRYCLGDVLLREHCVTTVRSLPPSDCGVRCQIRVLRTKCDKSKKCGTHCIHTKHFFYVLTSNFFYHPKMVPAHMIALAICFLCILIVVYWTLTKKRKIVKEQFTSQDAWDVFEVYDKILDRYPTNLELSQASKMTKESLESTLRMSDEYTTKFKTGKEATKPLSEQALHLRDVEIIRKNRRIYLSVKGRKPHPRLDFPMRDIVLMNRGDFSVLSDMLKQPWWPTFEREVIREFPNGLNRTKLQLLLKAVGGTYAFTDENKDGVDDRIRFISENTKDTNKEGSDRSDTRAGESEEDNDSQDRVEEDDTTTAENDKYIRKKDMKEIVAMIAKLNQNTCSQESRLPKHWHIQNNYDPINWKLPQEHPNVCINDEDNSFDYRVVPSTGTEVLTNLPKNPIIT